MMEETARRRSKSPSYGTKGYAVLIFCSYSSRFTVVKGAGGVLDLTPRVKNLAAYDDFVIQPLTSPTDIPCD